MNEFLSSLVRPLQPDARALVRRRFNDMVRELKYLRSAPHPDYVTARKQGWNREALEVVLALYSFYQAVLAPLASSGRNNATATAAATASDAASAPVSTCRRNLLACCRTRASMARIARELGISKPTVACLWRQQPI